MLATVDPFVGNLRFIPGGIFLQGARAKDVCRDSLESPQFQHTLSKGLLVMETEVTRQAWSRLKEVRQTLPADPSKIANGEGMLHPVQQVSWYLAVLFANMLSAQEGLQPAYYKNASFTQLLDLSNYQSETVYCNWEAKGYRLPTEGEWEYFARAETVWPFSLNEPAYDPDTCWDCTGGKLINLEAIAWFCTNSGDVSHPVGLKTANPWGLKDIHGNVDEWCWDWHWTYYTADPKIDDRGHATGYEHIIRGGSYHSQPRYMRSSYRSYTRPPSMASSSTGFRLVRYFPTK
jgi:formylglycine-generating enzyme required for sulfatase activity